ncbi:MAG: hypothetical protein ACE5NC_04180 [Anaerolineae bacterium]
MTEFGGSSRISQRDSKDLAAAMADWSKRAGRLLPWGGTLLVGLLLGCVPAPLLQGVSIDPSLITPNADGSDDVAMIRYRVTRPGLVSIWFEDSEGTRRYLRQDSRRSAGSYEILWGGVIGDRVLPAGTYRYQVEAVAQESAERAAVPGTLVIRNPDDVAPELENFTVVPARFTPNQDGLHDRLAISFRLTEAATVEIFLENEAGARYPVGLPRALGGEEILSPFQASRSLQLKPGLVEYDYDGGIDEGISPPPDGLYRVAASAQDPAGNVVRVEASLTIAEGGVPIAEVVFGEFEPRVVPLGGQLCFNALVENTGAAAIRTTGPPVGTTYRSGENFNTLGHFEEAGAFRLGVDFEGNSQGRRYPYRWQLGSVNALEGRLIDGQTHLYLLPGQRVPVSGCITIDEPPPTTQPQFWIGLFHEQVRIVNDFQYPTTIAVGF